MFSFGYGSGSPDLEFHMLLCRPFWLPREFTAIIITAVYIPPQANTDQALRELYGNISEQETACHTGCEAPDSGTEQISVQLDPGLPDRQKSGGQNGQQHLISPDPQHWCSAGLRPQPTPVLPVHT